MRGVPKLVHHKPTGQARVRLGSRDYYCGKFGTPEAQLKYLELVRQFMAGELPAPKPTRPTTPVETTPVETTPVEKPEPKSDRPAVAEADLPPRTVETLAARYIVDHVTVHYRHPDGRPTSEAAGVRAALSWLPRLPEGRLAPAEFGPKALKRVRTAMINSGLCRRTVNQAVGRIRRMFKWACGEELVSVNVYSALQAVAGLSRGRSDAPDHAARQPVDWETVAKTIPFLSAPLQAVVRVQWACGARGGELLQMRPCDIDRDGEIWRFTPHSHKNQWRGKQRVILLGKDAQAILLPLLANRGPEEFVFNPRDSRDQARVRTAYDSNTYVRQVARASKRAGVSSWSPHQIRHAYATRVRRVAGIESARILLGHSSAVTSELYAVADEQSVLPIVLQLG